jgi:hypothetical protein
VMPDANVRPSAASSVMRHARQPGRVHLRLQSRQFPSLAAASRTSNSTVPPSAPPPWPGHPLPDDGCRSSSLACISDRRSACTGPAPAEPGPGSPARAILLPSLVDVSDTPASAILAIWSARILRSSGGSPPRRSARRRRAHPGVARSRIAGCA